MSATAAEHAGDGSAQEIAVRVCHERPPQELDRSGETRRLVLIRGGEPRRERALGIVAELVHLCDPVHAPNGAERRALLLSVVLRPQMVLAILFQGNAGPA